jgi:Zn-dependent peptidase ImmA (M78 family)
LRAIELKRGIGVGADAAVDPRAALPLVPARLLAPQELREANAELARLLFEELALEWSGLGFGKSPADGVALILLNPSHPSTRQRATLMEEIAHILLQHPKTTLQHLSDTKGWRRTHNAAVEDEAFSVGAACLIPYPDLFHAIRDAHETVSSLALRFGVSDEYILFRIKRAGLYRVYRSRSGSHRSRVR